MSRVFVIHERLQRNNSTGEFEPGRDFSPAAEHGVITPVVGTGRPSHDPKTELALIQDALADYTSDDYLLLVGEPQFLAFAGAIAARASGGFIRWLNWDRRQHRYFASPLINVFSELENQNGREKNTYLRD